MTIDNVVKQRFNLDENFIKRLPKINIYQEQLKHLDKKTLEYYKLFLIHKLKRIKPIFEIKKWINYPGRFKQNEADFFKQLRTFVNPPKVSQQYQRPLEVDIKRGQQRVKMFMKLFNSIPSLKGKVMKVGADDACGNGVISKVIAQGFKLEKIDLFDPYVSEVKYNIPGLQSNFHSIPFEQRTDKKIKYDCVFLLAALHHITNPIEVIQSIKDSLKPDGLLFMREHLPRNQQEKMLLDCQELSWSYALQLEEPNGMKKIKDKTYPPQSYFTEKELYELIGQNMKLLGKLPEINYIQNEFMNYFIFQK